ncbi:uncharacterized protein C9orf152 homolog [Bombina bombina]|uniref:uncharacterized protein C9orf152 homolog n=1 Tax=Bombina bombina TaxID=8345 RepID=UPI00235A9509|nr:uncharacterized protein C9orf152 homolog [Bombina bombina]
MAWCCGCWEKYSLWDEIVKAFKYMSDILYVTHPSKDPAAGTRKLSKMDISRLEEQYYCITQKQKQQSHIIVFKSGNNELISGEPVVSTVPVNERVKKQKVFKEQVPVKDVALEVPDKNYLQDYSGPWHAHLNIHRMGQVDCHVALEGGKTEAEKERSFENKKLSFNRMLSYEKLPINDTGLNIKERKLSFTGEIHQVHSVYRKSSLNNTISPSWTHHQFPSSKPTSPTERVFYYPFPQKKSPRISETARKLGLYVGH